MMRNGYAGSTLRAMQNLGRCQENGVPTMIHRLLLICIVAVSCFIGAGQLARGQAQLPLCCYPDLQTAPPADLFFDKRSDGTYILRFSNTVMNMGRGRLEIQGNPKPRKKKDQDILR